MVTNSMFRGSFGLIVGLVAVFASSLVQAQPCMIPDNGTGTVDLPPVGVDCGYLSPDDVHMIIAGLPPGTTIRLGAAHARFGNIIRTPGVPPWAEHEQFTSEIFLQLQGTGELAGYMRTVNMVNVQVETDTKPRGTGAIQSFDTDMFMMQGQLPIGDPDFDLLRIKAGTSFGMPSPGHTTLTRQGGPGSPWTVDSFFDVFYEIEFIGTPGGPLSGMSGSTTGTIRMQTGGALNSCCMPNGFCVAMPQTQCNLQGGTPVSHCPLNGLCVPPGDDCFFTQCGQTHFDFCNNPIPADFFNPGSLPFEGIVYFQGASPTAPDTVVRRLNAMLLDGPPETIPIELVQLSLSSCSPITVRESVIQQTLWNVAVDLSPAPVPPGSMAVTKQHPNGGTFDASFPVQPRFIFTEVGNPGNVRILDTGAEGIPPTVFSTTEPENWVHNPTVPTPQCGVNFAPGIQEDPATGEQCCTETCHDNPAGGHKHCTKRCFVCPSGACCGPQNTCTIAAGLDACLGQYKGDGTNCNDTDGDGLADVFELNDCCQPSTACNSASSPTDPDTDNDGVLDGDELALGCDPCVPDCGSVNCCLPLGACVPMSTTACQSQGGIPLPAGVACQGDSDQDGIDDSCFVPPCGECGPGDHWIDQTPCPLGDPSVGGVCKQGGVNCLTDDDCTGYCHDFVGQNCLDDLDCTGHCRGNIGQNCLVDTDCGGICSVSGGNCATDADCTAPGGDVCVGNKCDGRVCLNKICNKLNAVGQDNVPSGAVLGIDTNFDCVADTNVIAGGPVTIRKRGPYDMSPSYPSFRPLDGHKDVIDTEIIGMSLTGGGVTLRAGTFSGSSQPLQPTRGAIGERPGEPALADSFFDVFFEIDLGGGTYVYNQSPVRVAQVIDCVPPDANYFHISGCLPLFTSPVPGTGIHVANLTAANHFTYPACCQPSTGVCTPNVSVDKCKQLGGTTVPSCLGDGNGNGRDDACEPKCEVNSGSPTGCTDICPQPADQQCLPSSYGCIGGGMCGVIDCNCDCQLIFNGASPSCQGNCLNAAETCPLVPSGDGSIGNPYKCDCTPQPQTGACCTFNGIGNVCTNTTQALCQGTFIPGVTCSGIMVACCLPSGVCTQMDEVCCAAAGGSSNVGGTCSGINVSCCLPSGSCRVMDQFCCQAALGTTVASCLGDNDVPPNGVDDACEPAAVCEPNATGTGCTNPQCPPPTGEVCQQRCANYNPQTGRITITKCDCRGTSECHLVAGGTAGYQCIGNCPTQLRVCSPRVRPNPDGTQNVCCDCRPKRPVADPTLFNKPRFVSLSLAPAAVAGGPEENALRVRLVSLHHVMPPYDGGLSIPFTAFEGQVRYAGPPAVYLESTATTIRFVASHLQCDPYYRDWTAFNSCSLTPTICTVDGDCPMGGTCTEPVNTLLHVTGSAITPSSTFEIEVLGPGCLGIEGTCEDVSDPLEVGTTRWGDVEIPFNPPSPTTQPDVGDISALVNKFKSAPGAPIKARALLAGSDEFGTIDLVPDLSFAHISACVDAFKGKGYPHTIQSCP